MSKMSILVYESRTGKIINLSGIFQNSENKLTQILFLPLLNFAMKNSKETVWPYLSISNDDQNTDFKHFE